MRPDNTGTTGVRPAKTTLHTFLWQSKVFIMKLLNTGKLAPCLVNGFYPVPRVEEVEKPKKGSPGVSLFHMIYLGIFFLLYSRIGYHL